MNGTKPAVHDSAERSFLSTLQLNIAIQDVVALIFHSYVFFRTVMAPENEHTELAQRFSFSLLAISVSTILIARGELLPKGKARALVYRTGLFVPMVLSYFEMRFVLPAVAPRLFDAELMHIDELIFGTSPVFWLDKLNAYPAIIEWLSACYYSYFWIMGLMLIPVVYLESHTRMAQHMMGALIICAVGHTGYTLVPAAGPVAFLEFSEELQGGFFLRQVLETVSAAGAQYDVFPSLHTAYLVYFALVAYGRRDETIFKYAFPILFVIASNMLVATIALRWHWAIDVVCGLILAVSARYFSIRIVAREESRRKDGARQELWERYRESELGETEVASAT